MTESHPPTSDELEIDPVTDPLEDFPTALQHAKELRIYPNRKGQIDLLELVATAFYAPHKDDAFRVALNFVLLSRADETRHYAELLFNEDDLVRHVRRRLDIPPDMRRRLIRVARLLFHGSSSLALLLFCEQVFKTKNLDAELEAGGNFDLNPAELGTLVKSRLSHINKVSSACGSNEVRLTIAQLADAGQTPAYRFVLVLEALEAGQVPDLSHLNLLLEQPSALEQFTGGQAADASPPHHDIDQSPAA